MNCSISEKKKKKERERALPKQILKFYIKKKKHF
jgi:hypothetical protein